MTMDADAVVNNDTAITSPSAKAFFAALDARGTANGGETRSQSSFVNKRIQTLGWRNRYSQQENYPVTIVRRQNEEEEESIHFSVRQVQRGEVEGKYGTGATVWPASMVLLKFLERHATRLVRGKRVADLGAGTGVTSIAAAHLGAKEVVCTDGEPNVVRLSCDNIQDASDEQESSYTHTSIKEATNETSTETEKVQTFRINNVPVHVQKYWWGSGTLHGGNSFDLVIVSDCVLPKLYPIAPLVDAIDVLLPRDNSEAMAVISYEHRYYPHYDPRNKFRELAHAKSLEVETVPIDDHHEVYSVEDIEIWLVRRKREVK